MGKTKWAGKPTKSWGVEVRLGEACESLMHEFDLTEKSMARYLREKASELDPRERRKTVYTLGDGTEISRAEYLKLKKTFGKALSTKLQEKTK